MVAGVPRHRLALLRFSLVRAHRFRHEPDFSGASLLVFGASTFMLGVLCAITQSDRSAYRFAGVTLAVVLLISAEWAYRKRRGLA